MKVGAGEHKEHAVRDIGFALVTVSDTRTEEDDHSGDLMEEMVIDAGYRVVHRTIIREDRDVMEGVGQELLAQDGVDAIIMCGGTGVSRRDSTIETMRPLMEKELVGFGELFRVLSMEEIGSAAIMSRATAGVAGGRVLFCIPGSKGAVRLAMGRLILEECGHILREARR
jgi:molybdenum cofactor biosynthesis protein B